MNLHEIIRNNLKESAAKEEQIRKLVNYLGDTYGSDFVLVDNVNGETDQYEILNTIATQYFDSDFADIIEFTRNIIDDPHGLLEVKGTNEINESSTEDYWDATEIARDGFLALLKFNFGYDSRGNNYIVTLDNNELCRFVGGSDNYAKEEFEKIKAERKSGLYDYAPGYDKIVESAGSRPAYVICYGQLEIWPNVESAKQFYREGMDACEGAEQERYMNIVYSLGHGNFYADDFGPEMLTSIVDRDANGNIVRERKHAGKMDHDQAIDYILKLQNVGLHESENKDAISAKLNSIAKELEAEPLIKKYMYPYTWTSGSSTTVYPITIWVESGEIRIQLDTDKNVFKKLLQKYQDKYNMYTSFWKSDGSCPSTLNFVLRDKKLTESEELPELPKNLIKYLDSHKGMDEFPTVEKEGTKWFSVSQEEYNALKNYVDKIDSIPEEVWRTWDDKKKLDISNLANNADRVCRNSVIKESVWVPTPEEAIEFGNSLERVDDTRKHIIAPGEITQAIERHQYSDDLWEQFEDLHRQEIGEFYNREGTHHVDPLENDDIYKKFKEFLTDYYNEHNDEIPWIIHPVKESEEIEFKDDTEAKLYDNLHNNIYFEKKDVSRNGLGKIIIDLKELSDEDFDKVAEWIKDKPEYMLNGDYKKVCIMGTRKDNKLDEAHKVPFNDYLTEEMLNEFANDYYKWGEEDHKWTKEEMEGWILGNKEMNPDTKIDLVHLDNLLDFQHELYEQDVEDGMFEEAEMKTLFAIITDEARKNNNYAHYSPREVDEQDKKELVKDIKKHGGKEVAKGKFIADDFLYDINQGITVSENNEDEYKVVPVKEAENKAVILDIDNTGGGVLTYVGEVGNYNFVGDIGGSVEFIPKKFNIRSIEDYYNLEDEAFNGKYGDDIKGTYDFEQKYAEWHPEYLPAIADALEDANNKKLDILRYYDQYRDWVAEDIKELRNSSEAMKK